MPEPGSELFGDLITSYLPLFAIWAATVVVVLPPLFGFS
jgi:hypothetical protein